MQYNEIKQGFHYFVMGWHLITRTGLRRFVIMPILLNILLLSGIFWLFLNQISSFIDWTMAYIPDWLGWLSYIILGLSILTILLLFYFIFTTLAGFIVAPFNGLLAEKVEKMLTGESISEGSAVDFVKDIPRMFGREWQKLLYSLPKFIGLFLLSFVPVIGQTVIPIAVFLFSAWMLAIQYSDYPFDNHKVPFAFMKEQLAHKRTMNMTFGTLISLCTFVPIINFLIIPVAVCGSTMIWVEVYRDRFVNLSTTATHSTIVRSKNNSKEVAASNQSKDLL